MGCLAVAVGLTACGTAARQGATSASETTQNQALATCAKALYEVATSGAVNVPCSYGNGKTAEIISAKKSVFVQPQYGISILVNYLGFVSGLELFGVKVGNASSSPAAISTKHFILTTCTTYSLTGCGDRVIYKLPFTRSLGKFPLVKGDLLVVPSKSTGYAGLGYVVPISRRGQLPDRSQINYITSPGDSTSVATFYFGS